MILTPDEAVGWQPDPRFMPWLGRPYDRFDARRIRTQARDLDTLPLNLFRVSSAGLYLNDCHLLFAYVLVMSLPLVAVFAVAQRRIISGITSGAVK
ncbi:hypothetical protein GCM10023170_083180 [Phytohabitans houttuyneae]|uniref:Uncharacterized protein n=1 Tax=Phytohabitans houttuyneae TaxID=1076126 RepID=A0A6V8KJ27_9ACTN|nr:hypothetical protein Phou_076200 [Phytohabitans houttuyneae]